ncbi:hypothetical protein IKG12_03155 [Candidatus Saccharibacteria bacterium]|nr:hypothetical protein [Candidatus Saccharibacteria bacterium]
MENPTDPDAGTNRTNAVSRDNLMEGAGLKYSGTYNGTSLNYVDSNGSWYSSTATNTTSAYNMYVYSDENTCIFPRNSNNKYYGRAVRYNKSLISS